MINPPRVLLLSHGSDPQDTVYLCWQFSLMFTEMLNSCSLFQTGSVTWPQRAAVSPSNLPIHLLIAAPFSKSWAPAPQFQPQPFFSKHETMQHTLKCQNKNQALGEPKVRIKLLIKETKGWQAWDNATRIWEALPCPLASGEAEVTGRHSPVHPRVFPVLAIPSFCKRKLEEQLIQLCVCADQDSDTAIQSPDRVPGCFTGHSQHVTQAKGYSLLCQDVFSVKPCSWDIPMQCKSTGLNGNCE